jgi:valyl-tRNA synthetase
MKELAKAYDPKSVEEKIYKAWEESGFFTPKIDKDKKPFVIAIPPPNVTGELHMGHALNNTIQDVLIRRKRMHGVPTLWIPGADHAGIATQFKVEQKLQKEGISKLDLGKKNLLKKFGNGKMNLKQQSLGN